MGRWLETACPREVMAHPCSSFLSVVLPAADVSLALAASPDPAVQSTSICWKPPSSSP